MTCWISFSGGAAAMASFTRRCAWLLNSVHVWGTKATAGGVGTLGMRPAGTLRRSEGTAVIDTEMPVPDLYAAQFDAFAGAVERGEDPVASGADGLRSVALTERLLQSAQRRG